MSGRPEVPPGTTVELPGRGITFYREVPGPSAGDPSAPAVVLLHGWTATCDLNWFGCYEALGRDHRVIAIDHRGHGRGIRTRRPFRLADCADDVAALCEVLGIGRAVLVGYSMGGPIAQLTWRRHRDLVAGLVLCATAGWFAGSREERLNFIGLTGLAALARLTPAQATEWLSRQVYLEPRSRVWAPWAIEEMAMHDWRAVLEAGAALGTYSARSWLGEIDVPTSVLVTLRDRLVPVARQWEMARSIAGAEAFEVDGDHDAIVYALDRLLPQLVLAVAGTVGRVAGSPAAGGPLDIGA